MRVPEVLVVVLVEISQAALCIEVSSVRAFAGRARLLHLSRDT